MVKHRNYGRDTSSSNIADKFIPTKSDKNFEIDPSQIEQERKMNQKNDIPPATKLGVQKDRSYITYCSFIV